MRKRQISPTLPSDPPSGQAWLDLNRAASCGESFGWVPSLLTEGTESGGRTSSGIIATPYVSTNAANFERTLPVCSSHPL